ncbi:MAG TPA: bifunctional demethylmenaquinone methyltransferase/2-methoxy-6-polyprenyl-1,4-benzoquinol methylase UbiE [Candidatus Angelobacter sp.]|nr:bifunctional demethylmenaquinone methyltransferase/2-methoxy-6-polyprenyl-1,4-benzoquinol methylase UbiE [Candidatus Angelobacter sp.]
MGQPARVERIRQMFDQVAPRYDVRNRFFSLNRDTAWRRRAARRAELKPGETALDLCCGTGKMAHELLPYVRPGGRVIGIDFSPAMLGQARQLEPAVEFRLADVTQLHEMDGSVDAVTIAFGLRNIVDRETALREMHRVLRRDGRLVILELAPPQSGPMMWAYRLYLSRFMPALAGLLSRDEGDAYHYLAQSVHDFLQAEALTSQLEQIGFRVSVERMTAGIVAIHTATKA